MPVFPDFPDFADIDLEIINILIKKEREEQNNTQKQPFLQLPLLEPPSNYEKEPKKENNDNIIIIDL